MYWTSPVFKWLKVVRFAKGPVFKWYLNTRLISLVFEWLGCVVTILMLEMRTIYAKSTIQNWTFEMLFG